MNNKINPDKYLLYISIILFIISLTQKCYCTTTSCSYSLLALLSGWLKLFSGFAGFAWLANPLLFASWITFLRKNLKVSMFLSVFSTLISLSFLLVDSIVDNEGGIAHRITSYGPGYWLWVASNITMLICTFYRMLRYNAEKRQPLSN